MKWISKGYIRQSKHIWIVLGGGKTLQKVNTTKCGVEQELPKHLCE